jgi:hypothetical protein
MVTLTIDFNNIVAPNKLDLLRERVGPVPETNLKMGLTLLVSKEELEALQSISKGQARVHYLNNQSFVSSVSGYTYVSYDPDKKVCEILRRRMMSIRQISLETMGIFPGDSLLWAAVPTEDPEFMDRSQELVFSGFGNPHMSNRSPSGVLFQNDALCMVKHNDNHTRRATTIEEVKYTVLEWQRKFDTCQVQARLTLDAVRYLRDLQHAGMSLNANGTITQKELAGNLKCESVDKGLVHYLGVDYSSIITGDEMGVPIAPGLYNFHSHPKAAYEIARVQFGWPSGQDYIGFLIAYLEDDTILHIVATIEGIYILSIGEYWIENKATLPRDLATFILENYDFCGVTGKTPHQYAQDVNAVRYKDYPLFIVQYFPWNWASQPFRVSYENKDSNCFTSDETWKYYERLYK